MDFLYEILENLAVFVGRDFIYKVAIPLVLILLFINFLGLLFKKGDAKEEVIKGIQMKVIGLVILILLPTLITVFLSFIEQVTGVKPNVDTSVIDRLQSTPGSSDSEAVAP